MTATNQFPAISRYCSDPFQKPHVAKIEQQSTWTNNDISIIIAWTSKPEYDPFSYEVPFRVLVALAADSRTPDSEAVRLKALVKQLVQAKQAGKSLTLNVERPRPIPDERLGEMDDILELIRCDEPIPDKYRATIDTAIRSIRCNESTVVRVSQRSRLSYHFQKVKRAR